MRTGNFWFSHIIRDTLTYVRGPLDSARHAGVGRRRFAAPRRRARRKPPNYYMHNSHFRRVQLPSLLKQLRVGCNDPYVNKYKYQTTKIINIGYFSPTYL